MKLLARNFPLDELRISPTYLSKRLRNWNNKINKVELGTNNLKSSAKLTIFVFTMNPRKVPQTAEFFHIEEHIACKLIRLEERCLCK